MIDPANAHNLRGFTEVQVMKRRKIEDEQEARACLAEVRRSGEDRATWARSRGIDGRSLHAWSMNLARGADAKRRTGRSEKRVAKSAALVELVPATAVGSVSRYAIRVGSVALEFEDDFEEATLRRAIAVLRSC